MVLAGSSWISSSFGVTEVVEPESACGSCSYMVNNFLGGLQDIHLTSVEGGITPRYLSWIMF